MIDGKTYGSVMGVEQVMAEVRKDSVFYFHSGGGLTISGGEPLAQVDFTSNLLKHAKDENINTAIETSLSVPYKQVGKVIPYLDIIYSDLKHIDPVKHKKYCGIDNSVILDNIRRVDGLAKDFKFVIRIPIIPGINDDSATLRGVGQFCASLRNLKHVQPLAYHRLGLETYRKMGKSYPLPTTSVPTSDHMDACRAILMEFVQVDAN
jgi:pyruvate formate lyase activating enzyme